MIGSMLLSRPHSLGCHVLPQPDPDPRHQRLCEHVFRPRGRAHGRGHRPGPELDAADHRAALGRLRAALCLHPAGPGAHRRRARQGAGHEGGARCPVPGARLLDLRAQCGDAVHPSHHRRRRRRRGDPPLDRADRRPGRDGQAPGGAQPLSRGGHRRPARRLLLCGIAGGADRLARRLHPVHHHDRPGARRHRHRLPRRAARRPVRPLRAPSGAIATSCRIPAP